MRDLLEIAINDTISYERIMEVIKELGENSNLNMHGKILFTETGHDINYIKEQSFYANKESILKVLYSNDIEPVFGENIISFQIDNTNYTFLCVAEGVVLVFQELL